MKPRRNYQLLLASQFLSAFGDNALLVVILGPLTVMRRAGQITEQEVNAANAMVSGLFFLPFILLAPLAGYLNDRYPKTTWLFGGNVIKLLGAAVGAGGMLLKVDLHFLAYCVVGIGACCYSPAKYGILPEIVPSDRLVKANGTVEMLTLAAILTGLVGGAVLVDHLPMAVCYGAVAGIYAVSLAFNSAMERTQGNAGAQWRESLSEFMQNLRNLLRSPRLSRVLLGTGLFWLCGATLRSNLQGWGIEVLRQGAAGGAVITNTQLTLLKVWLAVGIIVGSLVVGQFHRVGDLRGIRWYGWLMAAFIMPLAFINGGMGVVWISSALALTGVSAGLFLIPLNAALQAETDHSKLGKTIATQNFVDYVAMFVGAGLVLSLSGMKLSAAQIFLVLSVVAALIVVALRIPPRAEELGKGAA